MKSALLAIPLLLSTASAQPIVDRTTTGVGIALGGGLYGFTGDTLRDTTSAGGNWTARLTFGLRAPIALELAYIGSGQTIDALGIDNDAFLVSNGAQGALRFNLTPSREVTPFLYGGLAWRHYALVNTDTNTSAISDDDDVFEFPVGLGISTQAEGILIDLRGEFRYATAEDMVPDLTVVGIGDDDAKMHSWGVTLSFGAEI